MNRDSLLRVASLGLLLVLALWFVRPGDAQTGNTSPQTPAGICDLKFPLPNASDIGPAKFEKLLYAFLEKGCYKGWVADREIRNSGPFIGGASFGTHNAVKIFYSPEVWEWLKH